MPKIQRTSRRTGSFANSLQELERLFIGLNALRPPLLPPNPSQLLKRSRQRPDRIFLPTLQLSSRPSQSRSSAPAVPVHADSLQSLGFRPLPLLFGKPHSILRDQAPILLSPGQRP